MASMYDADNDAIFGKNLNVYSPMTTTPDFRSLCAELLAAFEIQLEEMSIDNRLCQRARAVLATHHRIEGPAQ